MAINLPIIMKTRAQNIYCDYCKFEYDITVKYKSRKTYLRHIWDKHKEYF